MSFKRRVQLFITFLVLLVSTVLTASYLYQQDKILTERSVHSSQNIKNIFDMILKDLDHFYTYRAYANLRSAGIKEAMLSRNKQELYELTLPRYRTLRAENPDLFIMQFHASDGRSILRMHRKEVYGDDIASRRPMLRASHSSRLVKTQFEGGLEGIAYRIVVPFVDNNKYIGALEFGIDPDYITGKLMETTGMEALFMLHNSRMAAADIEKYPVEYNEYRFSHFGSNQRALVENYVKDNPEFNQRIIHLGDKDYDAIPIYVVGSDGKPLGLLLCFNDLTRGTEDIIRIIAGSFMITMIMIIVLIGVIEYIFSRMMRKMTFQEKYIETIMNAQQNLIIVMDEQNIMYINHAFLEYFHYRTLDEFRKEHGSICELFETGDNESYLHSEMEGMIWTEYVLKYKEREHKTKMTIDGKTSTFTVHVQMIEFENKHHFVVVFTDITKLNNLATLDRLTQIANRFEFDKMLGYSMSVSRRYMRSLSVLLLDIDHFKHINDRFGHLIGDEVLKSFSTLLCQQVRQSDAVARWGGEEFIILLPDTSLASAIKMAESLRQRIEVNPFATVGNLTCSIGVAEFNPVEEADDLLHRADQQLYRAKNSGRNRVMA
ncbi:MAG: diguanylate cyclase [Sulfuricurvum sp.]|nr:diguanylate cyclase [Sulfuricurvum sp.]